MHSAMEGLFGSDAALAPWFEHESCFCLADPERSADGPLLDIYRQRPRNRLAHAWGTRRLLFRAD
jgi:hypothetical protein